MQTNIKELHEKYINNSPEGLTSKDIRSMSDEELLDIDYFMTEELDVDFGEEGFYIFLSGLKSLDKCTLFRLSIVCSMNICFFFLLKKLEFPISNKL